MKYLILIAVIFLAFRWLLRVQSSRRNDTSATAREPERMVSCAHCGVNQPISESVLHHGRYYCCRAHRYAADSGDD
jgi:uncharacterized protein